MNERAEEWVPLPEALQRLEVYERGGRAILGLEAARITNDERVLLPAFADFEDCSADQSWDFARRLLAEGLPAGATHVSFEPE